MIGSDRSPPGRTRIDKASHPEDEQHVSGEFGVLSLGVRNDAGVAFGDDGDRIPLSLDAVGRLRAIIFGDIAHDAVDSGNPIKIGGKAGDYGDVPAAVADLDRVNALFDRYGCQHVIPQHPDPLTKEFTVTDSDGAQTDLVLLTVGAGSGIVVTGCAAVCNEANTVSVGVRVGFSTSTLSARAKTGISGIVLSHGGIAPGSGYPREQIFVPGANNEELRMACDDPVGGDITVLVTYYLVSVT